MYIGQKQEVLSLSHLILEPDPVLLHFRARPVGGQIQRDAWPTMFLHEHFEVPFGSCAHPLHPLVAPEASLRLRLPSSAKPCTQGRAYTTRSGRRVAPSTCSVTLPNASRSKPPRPGAAFSI